MYIYIVKNIKNSNKFDKELTNEINLRNKVNHKSQFLNYLIFKGSIIIIIIHN